MLDVTHASLSLERGRASLRVSLEFYVTWEAADKSWPPSRGQRATRVKGEKGASLVLQYICIGTFQKTTTKNIELKRKKNCCIHAALSRKCRCRCSCNRL